MAMKNQAQPPEVLLKGGLLVDGTGGPPRTAHLLIRAGRIHRISERSIRTTGLVIDCAGLVVAPGFIDAHSHLDAIALPRLRDELKQPLTAQGLTTAVAGNCGASAAGVREKSGFRSQMDGAASHGLPGPQWDTVGEMIEKLASSGTCANLALLAGHGTARASIRGLAPSPLHPYEGKELLWLLEHAMDQGARGVSLGLQQVPGMFARQEELKEVALLVRRKGKVLAVHLRAYSDPSPGPGPGAHLLHGAPAMRETSPPFGRRSTWPGSRECACRSRTCSPRAPARGVRAKHACVPSRLPLRTEWMCASTWSPARPARSPSSSCSPPGSWSACPRPGKILTFFAAWERTFASSSGIAGWEPRRSPWRQRPTKGFRSTRERAFSRWRAI